MAEDIETFEELPDEYLREIGRVAVSWSQLESVLHSCLIEVLGKSRSDGRAHAVFAHMALPQRLQVLEAMIGELVLPPESPLLRYRPNVSKLLDCASKKRNAILHQNWDVTAGNVTLSGITARGSLKFAHSRMTLKELSAASLCIQEATSALYDAVFSSEPSKEEPQRGQ